MEHQDLVSSGTDMDTDMDMTGNNAMSDSMDASAMRMVFFVSTSTPLFSNQLSPQSSRGYSGICILLILLAITAQILWALKIVLERRWIDKARQRRYIVIQDLPTEAQRVQESSEAKDGTLITEHGIEEKVRIVTTSVRPIAAWRLSVELPRALLTTMLAGIGYLLMLAVMTMNVGYFLSVLGGILVGNLAVGRYESSNEH